jgi:uridine phosphorylase
MTERFTAEMFIAFQAERLGISVEELGVAPVVVVSWSPRVVRALAEQIGAEPPPHQGEGIEPGLFTGEIGGRRVSLARAPVGAPGTIAMMEEMMACGAGLFVGLGWAGSLQPGAPVGSLLVPTHCVREEGTSPHYVADDEAIVPDLRLVSLVSDVAAATREQVLPGGQWTIDAPYRELVSKIDAYRARGVLGVDMETSAMYALGRFRGVPVCNLLVVSDELWETWRPAFGTPELRVATERAQQLVLRLLEQEELWTWAGGKR